MVVMEAVIQPFLEVLVVLLLALNVKITSAQNCNSIPQAQAELQTELGNVYTSAANQISIQSTSTQSTTTPCTFSISVTSNQCNNIVNQIQGVSYTQFTPPTIVLSCR
uniref:Uncharacterized protein n=1 Tax=Acrobeloides nanus TaxID=290746 RepID=A0A914E7Z4_9BILA